MNSCGFCGQSNARDSRFCVDCGKPIAGAKADNYRRAAVSDANGLAILRGMDAGREYVSVSATGYEHVREMIVTGDDPAATIDRQVVLGSGAAVAGSVVGEDGKPVPGAYVKLLSFDDSTSRVRRTRIIYGSSCCPSGSIPTSSSRAF